MADKVDNPGSMAPVQVFISYSRRDLATAERVRERLAEAGFATYLDKVDILPGEPWQQRLAALIERADAVVFLVSPDSVASEICDWEVNEAERLMKRILPVVIRDVAATAVPGRLRRLNYVFLRGAAEEVTALAQLGQALLTDIEWVREHTRLGGLAGDWERSGRAPEVLLRGSALAAAELWVSQRPANGLVATEAHRAFISRSREGEQARAEVERLQVARTRRFQRRAAIGLGATGALVTAILFLSLWQSHRADVRDAVVLASAVEKAIEQERLPRALRLAVYGLPARTALPSPLPGGYWHADLERQLARAAQLTRLRRTLHGHCVEPRPSYSCHVALARFSPDGMLVLTASNDRTARIWDWMRATEAVRLVGHEMAIHSAEFDASGARVVTASSDRTVRIWSRAGVELLRLDGHERLVNSARFSPDGSIVVSASHDATARTWSTANGAQLARLQGHAGAVHSARFSPDGQRVATASDDGTARLWDSLTGVELAALRGHAGPVTEVRFSADGRRVITASWDKTARLWDADRGTALAALVGHEDAVLSVEMSPDGQRVLTGSHDKTARIWEAHSGRPLATLGGHGGNVVASFSADGSLVVTASGDHTGRIWDATSGVEIAVLKGHGSAVLAARFSRDGRHIVTAAADETTRIWEVQWTAPAGAELRDKVCAEILPGQARFTTEDATDPILGGLAGVDVCELHGPLAPAFWARLPRQLMSWFWETRLGQRLRPSAAHGRPTAPERGA